MNDQIKQGRNEILSLFVAGLTLSLIIIVAFNIQLGQQNIVPQLIRTSLGVFLMILTYMGSKVAKWLLTGLYIFGAVFIFQTQLLNPALSASYFFHLFMFVFYCFFPLFLQLSPNISEFLKYQKTKLNKG